MQTKRRRRSRRAQSGVTLVELMISMVIVSIAVAATFALGFSLVNGYREHRRMMEVERAARVSMEIVADAIRLSSAGVPTGRLQDLVGCSTFGPLRVLNHTNTADELDVIYASGGVLTSLREIHDSGDLIDVFDANELTAGDYIIITDGEMGHLRQIQRVDPPAPNAAPANVHLEPTPCTTFTFPTGGFARGSFVIRARISSFYIESSNFTGNVPTLIMDPDGDGPETPEPIAQGIEDMQIAVGIDSGPEPDGLLVDDGSTTDEWFYNAAGDPEAPPAIDTPPRAIRVTLIGRSIAESTTEASYSRPGAEDRAAGTEYDVYRRRVLSTVLEIRNLEGSPP